jgi:hypothetical protein
LPGTSADRAALQVAIMRQLHYYPSTASMAPHIVLHEIGAPFDLVLVDRTQDAHRAPDYLRLNPNGTIPVYTEDGWCCTSRPRSACTWPTPIRRPR